MKSQQRSRRAFVKGAASVLAMSVAPMKLTFAQTTIRVRTEWQEFRGSANYNSFVNAIRAMRANTNANDRSSWQYWINVHLNFCPHNVPNFLSWHRGYLYFFERQLRIVSGNNNLVLPYWDYYRNPSIPAEFTNPAGGNPLYVPRTNTNVSSALSLLPFDPSVTNFQRGAPNAFEPLIESAPHNPVHDIIGGVMQDVTRSPEDPIFYLHHANIDRLWYAWALPDSRSTPWTSAPYWSGSLQYAADLRLPRKQCYHPNWVGVDYADRSMPTSLPQLAMKKGGIIRVNSQQARTVARPPVGAFAATAPRNIAADRRSVCGASNIGLSEDSVSVRCSVQSQDRAALQNIIARARGNGNGPALAPDAYKSVHITFDSIEVLPAGKLGGFFYQVYLNLPPNTSVASSRPYLLGTLGAFEISAAAHRTGSHHGGGVIQLSFPATESLAKVVADGINELTVSLVRVNGDNSPRGKVIAVGEVRVELSTDEPFLK